MKPVYQPVTIARLERLAADTYLLGYPSPATADSISPGQFCMLTPCPGQSDVYLPRPFSYYSAEGAPGQTEILFRTLGRATRWMAGLRPGDTVCVFGPLGRGFTLDPGGERVILVAGGVGLPPLVFLARELARRQPELRIDLVYGESHGERVVPLEGGLPPGVRLTVATEDGRVGVRGLVTEPLIRLLEDCPERPAVYTCGPRAMMAAVASLLGPARVTRFEASLEENMACGHGICQGCVIAVGNARGQEHYECCCTTGPVFNGFEVRWR